MAGCEEHIPPLRSPPLPPQPGKQKQILIYSPQLMGGHLNILPPPRGQGPPCSTTKSLETAAFNSLSKRFPQARKTGASSLILRVTAAPSVRSSRSGLIVRATA